jgi:MarR-like DNA-binding transcriptional regulator SgrR of sgrS sRNA
MNNLRIQENIMTALEQRVVMTNRELAEVCGLTRRQVNASLNRLKLGGHVDVKSLKGSKRPSVVRFVKPLEIRWVMERPPSDQLREIAIHRPWV